MKTRKINSSNSTVAGYYENDYEIRVTQNVENFFISSGSIN
jgi:hypothetical protein